MSSINEIKEDIEELNSLLAIAKRSSIKNILNEELTKLQKQVEKSSQAVEKIVDSAPVVEKTKIYTVALRNYSWDQSEKFMKIYVSLNSVHTLPDDQVILDCSEKGFTITAKELDGKNYCLQINPLAHQINAKSSYRKVKKDMIVVYLAKASESTWSAVTLEEARMKKAEASKFSPKSCPNSDDPSAGLMDMMKEMYNSGDDDMKRMLNKTWYESQTKKAEGLGSPMGL